MDGREAKCALGFLLMGVAPVVVAPAGATVGIILFAAGILIATSAAFA
ncbi:MAG TPA: hypothetical protein PL090_04790 [Syntrophales bacterium]|nr:hypothetical protein [Syntrophales bacterium]HPQ60313.1 hypothetical protein [Syntrophales bacterium]